MPSTMSLNTRVHIVSRSGKKETITARDLLARGTGSAFEAFQMLDEYNDLVNLYKAEVCAASKKDRDDHLPFGSHLLPEVYQDFLYSWNKAIARTTGWWNGEERAAFRKNYPNLWSQFVQANKQLRSVYAAEVEQVKLYQATHALEQSDDETSDDEPDSTVFDKLPSLPPSPVIAASPNPMFSEQPDTDVEDDEQSQQPQQVIPQVLFTSEFPEQPDTDWEHESEDEVENQSPTRSHNPIYTNYNWPSPLAKVFVQKMRGNSHWDNTRGRGGAWSSSQFKSRWNDAGNTEFKLTHDNCIRYLAYKMKLTPEQLLEKKPMEVHAKLIGEYSGVPGYFVKRYY